MRVVIDPNLLVSYLLKHRGPIANIIDTHLAQENFTLLGCVQLLEELDGVLQYPKFQQYFDDETRLRFVALVSALSELVDIPDQVPRLVRDPKDDYLIACALAGDADFIVSGDKDVLVIIAIETVKMVTAKQFLETLSAIE